MPRIELIGDFIRERFILGSLAGRVRWTEETRALDRLGGIFLTKALLLNCYPNIKLGYNCLPESPLECIKSSDAPRENGIKFYSQLFELDPGSKLTVKVLERRRLEGEQQWSINGQLFLLRDHIKSDECVLFVEQEEYTERSRLDETIKIFEFVKNTNVAKLFIKTNQPHIVVKHAHKVRDSKQTVMLTTLRALEGNSLESHTWDAAVRHVLKKLGKLPKWMWVGVELWNEGCIWVNGSQCSLFWDMEFPLGAQRTREKGWTPGSMNVTCASLLSFVGNPNWPTPNQMKDSWVLSRQCALLGDVSERGEILDLPDQLKRLLNQDAIDRPRASAFDIATFNLPTPKFWCFLKELRLNNDLVHKIVKEGARALRNQNCPFLRVGRLFEVEEKTIEQLLTLNHLLRDFASRRLAARPLSIAVFGPAGSGKSFSVVELARSAELQITPAFFSYNLSQLRSVDDLEAAFHTVQSGVLRGYLPVVFWDEFDSTFEGQKLGWIKYFLGPMQDGEFFVRGAAHPLGRSIFVFAGASANTFTDFASRNDPESNAAKLPDFVSRIKAWLDVPQLPSSRMPAGRLLRAMLIHTLMQRHAPHIENIDDKVINFLLSNNFMTAREIERAIEAAALSDTNRFTIARLLFTTRKIALK